MKSIICFLSHILILFFTFWLGFSLQLNLTACWANNLSALNYWLYFSFNCFIILLLLLTLQLNQFVINTRRQTLCRLHMLRVKRLLIKEIVHQFPLRHLIEYTLVESLLSVSLLPTMLGLRLLCLLLFIRLRVLLDLRWLILLKYLLYNFWFVKNVQV
jgi:hypothetical protein